MSPPECQLSNSGSTSSPPSIQTLIEGGSILTYEFNPTHLSAELQESIRTFFAHTERFSTAPTNTFGFSAYYSITKLLDLLNDSNPTAVHPAIRPAIEDFLLFYFRHIETELPIFETTEPGKERDGMDFGVPYEGYIIRESWRHPAFSDQNLEKMFDCFLRGLVKDGSSTLMGRWHAGLLREQHIDLIVLTLRNMIHSLRGLLDSKKATQES
ncbi:hypothetical protein BJ508DRAFT_376388, partial [Ascobolus immersus RN42]